MQNTLRSWWHASYSILLLLSLVLLLFPSAVANAASSPSAGGRVTLPGHLIPALKNTTSLRNTNVQQTLHLSIGLALPDRAGLNRLLAAQNNRHSSLFHHYLTPRMFLEQFAPSQARVDKVVAFLKSQGLTVGAVSSNHLLIPASGTVASIENAFQVHLSDFRFAGRTVYAPTNEPSVPSSLAGLIQSIGGLDDVAVAQPANAFAAGSHQLSLPQVGSGPAGGYTPDELRTAYDMNSLLSTSTGAGQTIALVEFDGFDPTDLDAYLTKYQLGPLQYTYVLIDNATTTPGVNASEVELDMEVGFAIAPGASEKVYIAPSPNSTSVFIQEQQDVFNQIVMDDQAQVVSTSWGTCESVAGQANAQMLDTILSQGVSQGQAFFAASGDAGAYDCGDTNLAVLFPASDPNVVAVGGTTLNTGSGGTYTSETAWSCPSPGPNNSCTRGQNGDGSGGGLSTYFAQPNYQSGPGVNNSFSNGMREVPDVSADADPNTGYSIYCTVAAAKCPSTGWIEEGGTSAAAPLWASAAADTNQYLLNQNAPGLGSASYALYGLFTTSQPFAPYHDVNSGTNLHYPATDGYDLATGIGTPDVWNLAQDLSQIPLGPVWAPTAINLATTPGVNPASQTANLLNQTNQTFSWSLIGTLPTWLTVTPTSGSIPAGGLTRLTLTFNTSSTTPQTYATTVTVQDTNNVYQPPGLPVTVVAANVSKMWYFAEGFTGSSFSEFLTIENPNPTANSATVQYFLGSGAPITKTYALAANSRTTLVVNQEVGANQNVSMVVTGTLPIVAERPMYFTYTGLAGFTIPGGTDVLGATQLGQNFDFGYIDTTPGHDPYLTFLNPNSVAMNVSIQYFAAAGGSPIVTQHTFAADSRGTINIRTQENLPQGTYSALVSLDQPGLVERPFYFQDAITGFTGSADVVGVATPQMNWYFAEGYTNTNFSERYYLSNPNLSGSASATVTFFLSNGSTQATTVSIPAGGQVVVNANSLLGNNVNNSAYVSASLPILAERFMSFDYPGATSVPGATDVLGASSPSNLFYFAEGYTGTGFAEFLTIENPSASQTASVTATFYPDNGNPPTVRVYSIGPSTRFTLFTADVMPNRAFSMQIVSNVPIVAERPMYFNYLNSGQTGGSDVVGYQPPVPITSSGSVLVPATADWVNTGFTIQVGEQLSITASGSWSPDPSDGPFGPDGSPTLWPDNYLNLTDIGACASCATTLTPSWAALIGYIGDSPPGPGSYTSTSVLPEAQKIFVVGSNFGASMAVSGTLWLAFNDDAYSANTLDNSGQVIAQLQVTQSNPAKRLIVQQTQAQGISVLVAGNINTIPGVPSNYLMCSTCIGRRRIWRGC